MQEVAYVLQVTAQGAETLTQKLYFNRNGDYCADEVLTMTNALGL